MAEHHIQFYDTVILSKKYECMQCLVREAMEIELHPENVNGEIFLPERVMEASNSKSQGMKEGSF
jgi:hypothetical protein